MDPLPDNGQPDELVSRLRQLSHADSNTASQNGELLGRIIRETFKPTLELSSARSG